MTDVFATIEAEVVAIGEFLDEARRYRPLAAEADRLYAEAAGIATEVRRANRASRGDDAAGSEARMQAIALSAKQTLADFRAGALYRTTVDGLAADPPRTTAAELAALFADVEPYRPTGRAYLPLVAKRGKDVLEPEAAAEALAMMAADGIEPQRGPGVGGDARVQPVRFFESLVAIDAPLVVIVESDAIGAGGPPTLRAPELGEILVYAPRVRAPFVVGLRDESPDDWLGVRAGGYPAYRDRCRELVAARGLVVETVSET